MSWQERVTVDPAILVGRSGTVTHRIQVPTIPDLEDVAMNIIELLRLRGLDTNAKIKLVRHQDKRYDVNELYRTGYLDIYQSYQSKPVFNCEYLVSFIGWDGSRARFIGVYRVKDCKPAREVPLPPGFKPSEVKDTDRVLELAV